MIRCEGRGGGCRVAWSQAAGRLPAADPEPSEEAVIAIKKNIHFEFSQDLVRQPLLYQLNRTFDVVINICGASVTEEGGFIALELEGSEEEIDKVIRFLEERGVKVSEGLGGEGGAS